MGFFDKLRGGNLPPLLLYQRRQLPGGENACGAVHDGAVPENQQGGNALYAIFRSLFRQDVLF